MLSSRRSARAKDARRVLPVPSAREIRRRSKCHKTNVVREMARKFLRSLSLSRKISTSGGTGGSNLSMGFVYLSDVLASIFFNH